MNFKDVHLMVATPCRAKPHMAHMAAIMDLQGAASQTVGCFSWITSAARTVPEARSELVRIALDAREGVPPVTHLVMIDSDMAFESKTIFEMIELDVPLVGCAYAGRGSDARNLRLLFRPLENEPDALIPDERKCVRVRSLGLGLTLIRRDVLVQMTERYRETLEHRDGEGQRMLVNLFYEPIEEKNLYGEDFAFFERWRKMGGEVLCYTDAKVVHFIEIPFAVNASDYIVEMAKGNTSGPVQEDES
jgi:hypothetical protein